MNLQSHRPGRSRRLVIAALAGAIGLAVAGGTAYADPPWAQDGWHGHHGWHHRDNDGWRGGYAGPPGYYYPPPPPVYYAPPPPPPPPVYYAPPPPVYYGPPSLSFGINVPLAN
ncbi:hypothetical protein [Acidiphilium sp.]|uniref:hypothetical protein n=1 Tax=Acidiphilium sp. TaxID=527 RepID=UPI003D07A577